MDHKEYVEKMNDLINRRAVANACIAVLNTVKDDPRYPDAIEEYKGQLEKIEQRIADLEAQPHDVIIGLKTAKLFAVVPPTGD